MMGAACVHMFRECTSIMFTSTSPMLMMSFCIQCNCKDVSMATSVCQNYPLRRFTNVTDCRPQAASV